MNKKPVVLATPVPTEGRVAKKRSTQTRKAVARKKPQSRAVAAVVEIAPNPEVAPKKKDADRVIRDGFSMPKAEYELIKQLKTRALAKGVVAKKSEILRAGLSVLTALSDTKLTAVIKSLVQVKTGRRNKNSNV